MPSLPAGFLKPSGEWVDLPTYGHMDWAIDECARMDWSQQWNATNILFDHGYLQVSGGHAFLSHGHDWIKLTTRQEDWLMEHVAELDHTNKTALVTFHGMVFPDVAPTDYSTPLITPEPYRRYTDGEDI